MVISNNALTNANEILCSFELTIVAIGESDNEKKVSKAIDTIISAFERFTLITPDLSIFNFLHTPPPI